MMWNSWNAFKEIKRNLHGLGSKWNCAGREPSHYLSLEIIITYFLMLFMNCVKPVQCENSQRGSCLCLFQEVVINSSFV